MITSSLSRFLCPHRTLPILSPHPPPRFSPIPPHFLHLYPYPQVGSELYKFKVEQYKEISTTRAEIQKIVQEQRLLKIKTEYERERREEDRQAENEKWIDEQRKMLIDRKINPNPMDIFQPLVATAQQRGQPAYDRFKGFYLQWSLVLGIPKRIPYAQIVYAIYEHSDVILNPKLVGPQDCSVIAFPVFQRRVTMIRAVRVVSLSIPR